MAVIQLGRPGQHLPRKRVTGTSAARSIGGGERSRIERQEVNAALRSLFRQTPPLSKVICGRGAEVHGCAVISVPRLETTAAARIEAAGRRHAIFTGNGTLILRDGRRIDHVWELPDG